LAAADRAADFPWPSSLTDVAPLLASDDAAYVTGTTIVVDGGQILPEALV
jgi:3-oxoacyl-[acyl-carrier protein] reductase